MKYELLQKAENIIKQNKTRRVWKHVIVLLAFFVVITTAYGLMLPAVTLDRPKCGLEEHIHSDECYEWVEVEDAERTVCSVEAFEVHEHIDSCFDEQENRLCGYADFTAHTHEALCYDDEGNLRCDFPEIVLHEHKKNCYEKSEASSDDEAYAEENAGKTASPSNADSDIELLICEEEEIILHTHSKECFDESGIWICGQLEIQEHQHTELCFPDGDSVKVLVCEIPEHQHTDACSEMDSLPCGCADYVIHVHDENCYNESGTLWCELEEIEEHVHDELCYMVLDIVDEDEYHIHTEACYGSEDSQNSRDEEEDEVGETEAEVLFHSPSNAEETYSFSNAKTVKEAEVHSPSNAITAEESGVHSPSNAEEQDEGILGVHSPSNADGTSGLYGVQTPSNAEKLVLICGYQDITDLETELTCDLREVEFHVHEEMCWNLDGSLNCEQLEVREHQHSSDCIVVDPETGDTSCAFQIHEHTDACYELPVLLSAEEMEKVRRVIAMIDELPDMMTIGNKLAEYEEAGDDEGYAAYFTEVSRQALTVYAYYEELSVKGKEKVTNIETLMQLQSLWAAQPMAITDTETVYQVNNYTTGVTTLVYGGSVKAILGSGMSFTYWSAVVVEKDASGQLYIAKYDTADVSKLSYEATTSDGFVLLFYGEEIFNASVGDSISINFSYKDVSGYQSSGHGTVSAGDIAAAKPYKDNTSKLGIVSAADTSELIELNLYDYGDNINEWHGDDTKYPGFQQAGGQTSVGRVSESNFGDNVTADFEAGKTGVTNGGGDINKLNATHSINRPISGALSGELVDGYPALSDGTSLKYLFSDNVYAEKANTDSINGLFQYDETTGAYTYNSRLNHAQYNGDDTFTLYEQIISPNFTMYPFGNFLPFNDIVHESAQASTIDRSYIKTIAGSAQAKFNNGYGSEYGTLSSVLNGWISKMDTTYGTNWDAEEAILAYFNETGAGGSGSVSMNEINSKFKTEKGMDLLPNLYSIDYDEPSDFYFGMEMKMNLMQPKGGLTGIDGKQPMKFYFTGDDDVWVYLDGKLFLDLSGIHRHVGGEIDFVNGKVMYYELTPDSGDVSTTPYDTKTFKEILGSSANLNEKGTFPDYSTHTFNFYYMERGSGSGICRLNFNFPLLRENAISVKKELSVDDETQLSTLGNPDFKFQILKANSDGTLSEELFIGADTAYDVYDANGKKLTFAAGEEPKTDENGILSIKAGQTAVFPHVEENDGKYYVRELLDSDYFAQYGKVTVDGNVTTTDSYDNTVTVGNTDFQGIASPVKDASDGATVFDFENYVDFDELGSLSIAKELVTYPPTSEQKSFDMQVSLDGALLSEGTAYTVTQTDGTIIEKTVAVGSPGIISILSGEKATINRILAGTEFEVIETAASAEGYTVSYEISEPGLEENGERNIIQTSNPSENGTIGATGVIKTKDAEVLVKVTNAEPGTTISIPVSKSIENPDGQGHTFRFELVQVQKVQEDEQTDIWVPIETYQPDQLEITIDASGAVTPSSPEFRLYYAYKNLNAERETYYYKVYEAEDTELSPDTQFDQTEYVFEVEVSKQQAGAVSAEIKNVWRDGSVIDTSFETAAFTNILLRDLTVSKKLTGGAAKEFEFEVSAQYGGQPLNGVYLATKHTEAGSVSNPVADELMELTFTDGKTTFGLLKDQSMEIHGIPYGASWEAKEISTDGYRVSYQVDADESIFGSVVTGTLQKDITITFINASNYQLPQTGGSGKMPYILGGFLLLTLAGFGFPLYKKNRFRKEDWF